MKLERSMPHGKYQKVPLISTDLSTKFKISFNDNSFENLNVLSRALGASNLLSLVDGSRLIPQRSENYANGYTPSSITESSEQLSLNRNVATDEDDNYRYAEEESNAFRFIESFLHIDMKHILVKSVKRKDPRQLFQDIHAHFRGNQFHHVDKAIKTISKHKVHPGLYEGYMANFRIYISDLTHAQSAEVPEQQKFAYLKELLTHDTRQCLANALDFNKLDFGAAIDLLISTHSNQPAGSIRMAGMGSTDYCFDFQKGECIRKNCRYLHKLMSDHEELGSHLIKKHEKGIPKGKKINKREKVNSKKNNNSTGTNGMHNTNKIIHNSMPLRREHQVQTETPRGIINSSNPNGYSAFQRKLMGSLQRTEMNNLKSIVNSNPNILNENNMVNNNDNNSIYINNNINNGNFETWNKVSLQPFNNNDNNNNMINNYK